MKNYYEILEVNKKASIEIITRAYKVLIKKYHPDNFIGEKKIYAENKTKDLNEAYHVLSDYFLREQYDLEMEKEFNNSYKNINVIKNNVKDKGTEKKDKTQKIKKDKTPQTGSFMAIISLTKELFSFVKTGKKQKKEPINQKTWIALIMTVIIVILILIAMWFIPFTNGFMRELTVDNPLISWMFK